MNSRIGYQMPAYCSGSGKVLLADLLDTDREDEIKKYRTSEKTETTITDYSTLLKELYKIKEIGYGIDKEESEVGLTCIAVPILTYNAKPSQLSAFPAPPKELSKMNFPTCQHSKILQIKFLSFLVLICQNQ